MCEVGSVDDRHWTSGLNAVTLRVAGGGRWRFVSPLDAPHLARVRRAVHIRSLDPLQHAAKNRPPL